MVFALVISIVSLRKWKAIVHNWDIWLSVLSRIIKSRRRTLILRYTLKVCL